MPERKSSEKLSFPLSEAQLREAHEIAARIEAFGRRCILGFPRTSPSAIAAVRRADMEVRPWRYWDVPRR